MLLRLCSDHWRRGGEKECEKREEAGGEERVWGVLLVGCDERVGGEATTEGQGSEIRNSYKPWHALSAHTASTFGKVGR